MTPDEHAAEAERLLNLAADLTADDTARAAVIVTAAHAHALLATRPVALEPLLSADPPPRQPTIVDYDNAMMRAVTALHEAMPAALSARYTLRGVLPWAKAAVDAFADTPTSET